MYYVLEIFADNPLYTIFVYTLHTKTYVTCLFLYVYSNSEPQRLSTLCTLSSSSLMIETIYFYSY